MGARRKHVHGVVGLAIFVGIGLATAASAGPREVYERHRASESTR